MIDSPPNAATEKPWGRRLTLALVALSLLGPMAYKHAPREVARWHHAIAAEQFDKGREEEALRSIETALRWSPDDDRLYLQVAAWKREAGRFEEALEWCGKARERGVGHESAVLTEETENLWSLKRWNDALALWKQVAAAASEAGTLDHDPRLLNSLAYARALANTELEEALRDINEAIALAGSEPAMLDTRGFIQFRRGELDAALRDLDNALQSLGVPAAAGPAAAATNASKTVDAQKAEKPQSETPQSETPQSETPQSKTPQSKTPKETANGSPSKKSGQPQPLESKPRLPPGSPQSTPLPTPQSTPQSTGQRRQERLQQRTQATLLYHRMLILEKQGQASKAAEDRRRIESLGFRPDDSLF
jgi:tetratricopeptide (TPR) repeat protein